MTREYIINKYFNWMCGLICGEGYSMNISHYKLLEYLYHRDFDFELSLDSNRYDDGTDLRYRFGYEQNYPGAVIAECLDNKPCSILEMMIALSIRCEEHIMDNPEEGNRTGQWFWNMIRSLGLYSMTDSNFNETHIDHVITHFMKRDYNRDGSGGLFTVQNSMRDMRTAEIWYQMMWYLDEVIGL
ncbi:MAG: hypothetical protein PHS74_00460 [Lachnospiraceae bacterium]|nr:hypothetical protein [Lachnospiraceae bacterium]